MFNGKDIKDIFNGKDTPADLYSYRILVILVIIYRKLDRLRVRRGREKKREKKGEKRE